MNFNIGPFQFNTVCRKDGTLVSVSIGVQHFQDLSMPPDFNDRFIKETCAQWAEVFGDRLAHIAREYAASL